MKIDLIEKLDINLKKIVLIAHSYAPFRSSYQESFCTTKPGDTNFESAISSLRNFSTGEWADEDFKIDYADGVSIKISRTSGNLSIIDSRSHIKNGISEALLVKENIAQIQYAAPKVGSDKQEFLVFSSKAAAPKPAPANTTDLISALHIDVAKISNIRTFGSFTDRLGEHSDDTLLSSVSSRDKAFNDHLNEYLRHNTGECKRIQIYFTDGSELNLDLDSSNQYYSATQKLGYVGLRA